VVSFFIRIFVIEIRTTNNLKQTIMARIKIDLDAWESAPSPICTENVDLKNAEMALYNAMRMIWGYDNKSIKDFCKGIGDERDIDIFNERLCQEEEECILEWGGYYY
jgi:hypothetical protein